jgi:hypothetical protein
MIQLLHAQAALRPHCVHTSRHERQICQRFVWRIVLCGFDGTLLFYYFARLPIRLIGGVGGDNQLSPSPLILLVNILASKFA